jgi:hypothetical protein
MLTHMLSSPIVIADAGLLFAPNIKGLRSQQNQFILGARLKKESDEIKDQILAPSLADGAFSAIRKPGGLRLIVSYSTKHVKRDRRNRARGLKRHIFVKKWSHNYMRYDRVNFLVYSVKKQDFLFFLLLIYYFSLAKLLSL